MNIYGSVYNRIDHVLNVSQNIGSRNVETVNILEVITRCTEGEIKEEEIGQNTQLLQSIAAMIDDAPCPVDLLLRRWTVDNLTDGLPIKEGALHAPAKTWIERFMEFDGTDRRDKAETKKKGIRGPTAEGLLQVGECNHHFFGLEGGLTGRVIIIHFRGKRTWGEIGNKDGQGVVLNVIIWEDVLGGLVLPRMSLVQFVLKWGISHRNVGEVYTSDTPHLSLGILAGQVV